MSGGRPASIKSDTNPGISATLKKSAIDALFFASFINSSSLGTGVLPARRVKIAVCVIPGIVNSAFIAAAAANTVLTPGITSYSMFSLSNSFICSEIAPYIAGSPV